MPKKKPKSARQLTLNHTAALIEHIDAKFDAVLEMVQPIPQMQTDMHALKEKVEELTDTTAVHGQVLKEHSQTLKENGQILKGIDRKLDATMEEVANVRVDLEVVKQTVTKHDQKIKTL